MVPRGARLAATIRPQRGRDPYSRILRHFPEAVFRWQWRIVTCARVPAPNSGRAQGSRRDARADEPRSTGESTACPSPRAGVPRGISLCSLTSPDRQGDSVAAQYGVTRWCHTPVRPVTSCGPQPGTAIASAALRYGFHGCGTGEAHDYNTPRPRRLPDRKAREGGSHVGAKSGADGGARVRGDRHGPTTTPGSARWTPAAPTRRWRSGKRRRTQATSGRCSRSADCFCKVWVCSRTTCKPTSGSTWRRAGASRRQRRSATHWPRR